MNKSKESPFSKRYAFQGRGKYLVDRELLTDRLLRGDWLCGIIGPYTGNPVLGSYEDWSLYWDRINTEGYTYMTSYLYNEPEYERCFEVQTILRLMILRDFFNELNEHGVIK